ncbi:MAG: phosphatidate cytidylyltransferase [Sphingomonadales bacterium]|nr:phosphatidate cytidylyltransferase [Sphingomonadales bacterium]MDE2169107.1 phosphatidate cytidylyltransferase [Sphingomonadales bacterium]
MPSAAAPRNSDLKLRTLSAIVMIAVAGTALWLSGVVWQVFVLAVSVGVLWEWNRLVRAIAGSRWARLLWLAVGVAYVGTAGEVLVSMPVLFGRLGPLIPVMLVIATDVGAYFSGRALGGPKIAPRVSPSKTWSGLGGGALLAACVSVALAFAAAGRYLAGQPVVIAKCALLGALVAVIAQAGDFFESWMKRRAGVKDSGSLLPGHGGLFDRVDGLLAVLFVAGLLVGIGRLF